ncbi:serine hydrolase domain-containing protein [Roseococcus microcysteis]|uniref:serine hydrolase domain-containing protein n=1 Tax=Roseococcus microcysteis TaxID=2771361 RepID=UPI00168AE65B|nr:serine hydrolase [Roseococcus microcysteis]
MRDLDLLRLERRVGQMLVPLAETPGAAVGVARDGMLLLRRSAGLASIELNAPIGIPTTFRIASVSKQFTCAAILMLARDGLLRLDDTLGAHLPWLPAELGAVTLDQAMRNAGGLRDVLELARLGGADLATPVTEVELDALIARQEGLNFAPGTRFLYSNTGFRLLGQVVERVARQSLAVFLERRIFGPLGMTRTRHTPDLSVPVPGLATGYLPDGAGGWRRAPHGFPLGGEGGLVSGVEDLALWARCLSLGTLQSELEGMIEETAPFANGAMNRYARGLEVENWRGIQTVSHGGLWPGYKTAFLRVPERRLTVIVITNNASLDPHHMALQVLEAALQGDPALRPPPPHVPSEGMAGTWLCEEAGLSLDIEPDLLARMHGVPFTLIPGEDGRLTARRGAFPFQVAPRATACWRWRWMPARCCASAAPKPCPRRRWTAHGIARNSARAGTSRGRRCTPRARCGMPGPGASRRCRRGICGCTCPRCCSRAGRMRCWPRMAAA